MNLLKEFFKILMYFNNEFIFLFIIFNSSIKFVYFIINKKYDLYHVQIKLRHIFINC